MSTNEYLPRIVDRSIAQLLDSIPVITIEGARATGKTTTAARFTASELRLPRDLDLLESDPEGVLGPMPRPTLIDEWQLAGVHVLWAIKNLVDADPRPGSFILTGSVEPESYGPTYPLTGRGARVVMHPMTRRELAGDGDEPLWIERLRTGTITRPSNAGQPTSLRVVTASGFPATATLTDPAPWLQAYGASIAERSIEERRDPQRVGLLLKVLAELESAVVPDERIWRAADINRETLRAYDSMLGRTHVSTPLPAWSTNRLKRLTTQPKRQLVDAALALALAGIGPEQLDRDPAMLGPYLESFVAAQIRPEVAHERATLHHLRTRAGEQEVDLLVDLGDSLIAIEVKASVRVRPRDVRHLVWLKDQLGDRLSHALVMHRGTSSYEVAPGVWALPISGLWSGAGDRGA